MRLLSVMTALLARPDSSLVTWDDVAARARPWAARRAPREGDVPIVLYRDANAWCPFSHRIFYYLEERGLRYLTERIHLQGEDRRASR